MRFSFTSYSFSYLQYLAAATTESTMSYSSRASYSGRIYWRRGYSDRPSGGRDEFVSGDSHIRSVSDSNYAHRQVDGQNYPNHGGFRQPFQQSQPPHQPPYFYQPTPPYQQRFNQPRPFRPNYKPPDYRNWEYALSQPPSYCERFVVLSYNILADYLAINHRRELYWHIPPYILDWEWRKGKLLFEFGLWSPDIMCLQEVDRFQDLEEELKLKGYSGIWKMRTGIPVDGCAIFWRTTRFKLLHEESIEYNKFQLRDNVAQICVFETRNQNCADIRSDALPQSSNGVNHIVICNTHVLYNPKRGEIKLGQVRMLLYRAHAVSRLWNDAPVIICGDFNCTPKSPLYNFILEQKLDLTGVPRDQISGQSSAQIHTPMPFTPNQGHVSFRAQAPDNSNRDSMLGEVTEVGAKQSDCIPNMHNHTQPNNTGESVPFTNNLHQSQSATGVGYISHKSCSAVHYREKNNAISDESSKDIEHEIIDNCKNNVSSGFSVSVELHSVDSGNVGIQDLTPPLTSRGISNSVVVENGQGDQSSGSTDHSLSGTSTQMSRSNSHMSGLIASTTPEGLDHDDMDKGKLHVKENVTSEIHAESKLVEKLGKTFVQDITSDMVPDTSFAGVEKANPSASNLSVQEVDISDVSTSVNFNKNQKLFSLNNLGEVTKEDESFGQAGTSILSLEVYRAENVFQSDVDLDSKSVRLESVKTDQYLEKQVISPQKLQLSPPCDKIQSVSSLSIDSDLGARVNNTYDPSSWTPMEIETASGNAECTLLEHPLKLRSTYAEVEVHSGTRDSSREPQVTSYNRRFMGTVDYIWCSEGLQTVKVLDTIPKHALQWTPGFPTRKWGSDHIALASQLAFTKDMDRS